MLRNSDECTDSRKKNETLFDAIYSSVLKELYYILRLCGDKIRKRNIESPNCSIPHQVLKLYIISKH